MVPHAGSVTLQSPLIDGHHVISYTEPIDSYKLDLVTPIRHYFSQ